MNLRFILVFCLLSSFTLSAQVVQECGAIPDEHAIEMMSNHRQAVQEHTSIFLAQKAAGISQMTIEIPVQAHIINKSDGTDGISLQAWNHALANLNEYYADANLKFVQCDAPNIINSDTFFDFDAFEEQNAIVDLAEVDNVMNVYIPGGTLINFSGTEICGYAYFPWSTNENIVIRKECMSNTSTFPHEVGHYLGLYHTHGTRNCGVITDELVNGSNCSSRGDDVCDTAADPNLYSIDCDSSLVDSMCNYIGTLRDINGDLYAPDPRNIMSYSRRSCRSIFTPGQLARANFYATTARNYLSCGTLAAPANDICQTAIVIDCGTARTGNTFHANPFNSADNCEAAITSAPGVWYRLQNLGTSNVTLDACDAGYNTQLVVYSGDCNRLNCVNSVDNSIDCALGTVISFDAQADNDYYVYVTGSGTNRGPFTLNINCILPPLTLNFDTPDCHYAGDTSLIPITVDGFTEVLNFQFSIELQNQAVGRIADIDFLNLPADPVFAIIDNHTASVVWDNNTGVSLEAGDTIAIVAVVINETNEVASPIDIVGAPTPIYAESAVGLPIPLLSNQGSITRCTTAPISGQILREDGVPLANVQLLLTEGDQELATTTTDLSGRYTFFDVPFGNSYTILPSKDGYYLNGVNAGDLSRIQQHLLSVNLLDSPYKYVAADVSAPSALNSGDLSRIRQLIFGDITAFTAVDSWQFVATDFEFPNPQAPTATPFAKSIQIDNFQVALDNLNFTAMKSGDVTNGAITNTISQTGLEFLISNEASAISDQIFTVDIKGIDFTNMLAAQYSINWDSSVLTLDRVHNFATSLDINMDNFSFSQINNGTIPWVWFSSTPASIPDSTILFSIDFVVTGNTNDQIELCFGESPTRFFFESDQQVLNANFNKLQTTVVMTSDVADTELRKEYQVYPNPVKAGFYIIGNNESDRLQLDLFTLDGKKLKSWNNAMIGQYFKTYDLPKGAYHLSIKNKQKTLVKSLIIE